jgi:hypothetical protein
LIADEECPVLLGRIARSKSMLADAALESLKNIDLARAVGIAAAIRRVRPPGQHCGLTPMRVSTSRPELRIPGTLSSNANGLCWRLLAKQKGIIVTSQYTWFAHGFLSSNRISHFQVMLPIWDWLWT